MNDTPRTDGLERDFLTPGLRGNRFDEMRALARDIERELAELNEEFIRLLEDHEKALEKCRRLERENVKLLAALNAISPLLAPGSRNSQ